MDNMVRDLSQYQFHLLIGLRYPEENGLTIVTRYAYRKLGLLRKNPEIECLYKRLPVNGICF